ncbi:MAG: hypothetical protein PQJ44_07665 [Sphaerochaetaceae bacterium]|nr:hypothetical protein [Sphaerochaetaceae bacterium]
MNNEIVEFLQDQFEESEGYYYSPSFKSAKGQLKKAIDMYITVEAILAEEGVVSIQTSIDKEN